MVCLQFIFLLTLRCSAKSTQTHFQLRGKCLESQPHLENPSTTWCVGVICSHALRSRQCASGSSLDQSDNRIM